MAEATQTKTTIAIDPVTLAQCIGDCHNSR